MKERHDRIAALHAEAPAADAEWAEGRV